METKVCKKCERDLPLNRFRPVHSNKSYIRGSCRACERGNASYDRDRHNERIRTLRKEDPTRFIWADSRKADRKKGLANDLTKDFVRRMLERSCFYCGETQLRMTLDRVDNKQGHLQSNVVPACIRCNYVRRDMPYEAWLIVASSMREARKRGLFGDWEGRARGSRPSPTPKGRYTYPTHDRAGVAKRQTQEI
jgi:hypothetical protein